MTMPGQAVERAGLGYRARLMQPVAWFREVLEGRSEGSRARRMALTAFTIRVASAAIAYFSQAFLARWMGSFEYGIFVFVWVWVLIIGGLSSIGLNTSVIRFLPHYGENNQWDLVRGLALASRWVAAGIASLIAIAGMAGLYLFAEVAANPYVLPAYLMLICLPLYALMDVQDGLARAYSWIGLALVPPYLLRPLLLLVTMVAAFSAGLEMTAATAAGAAIAATWVTALVQLVMFERQFKERAGTGNRSYTMGVWVKASLPIVLIEGFDHLLQHTDVLVLTRYWSPSDVAIYFAAAKTMALIVFIRFAVSAGFANKFSTYHAQGDHAKLEAFVRDAVRWTLWPSLAAAIALLAIGKPLLWLFGPEFTAGYPVMFVLAAGFLIRSIAGPADFLLNMLGKQVQCAKVLFISAALNIVLNFFLIPAYGPFGAALATSIALAVSSYLFVRTAERDLGIDILIWRRKTVGGINR